MQKISRQRLQKVILMTREGGAPKYAFTVFNIYVVCVWTLKKEITQHNTKNLSTNTKYCKTLIIGQHKCHEIHVCVTTRRAAHNTKITTMQHQYCQRFLNRTPGALFRNINVITGIFQWVPRGCVQKTLGNWKTYKPPQNPEQCQEFHLMTVPINLQLLPTKSSISLLLLGSGWMDERCFRPLFCTIKADLGRGQPGLFPDEVGMLHLPHLWTYQSARWFTLELTDCYPVS